MLTKDLLDMTRAAAESEPQVTIGSPMVFALLDAAARVADLTRERDAAMDELRAHDERGAEILARLTQERDEALRQVETERQAHAAFVDTAATAARERDLAQSREAAATQMAADLRKALETIARWSPETFPRVPVRDDPTHVRTISYGAAYGSNGERDFMRNIARAALNGDAK